MSTAAIAICLALLAASPPAKKRVMVYDFRGDAVKPAIRENATRSLLQHLGRRGDLVVIGEAEMETLVRDVEDRRSLALCEGSAECLAKLDQLVDAELVLTGRIGQFDGEYLAVVNVANTKRAEIQRAESCRHEAPEPLFACLRDAADQLLGAATSTAAAPIDLAKGGASVAVTELVAFDVPPQLAQNVTELLSLELRNIPGFSVVTKNEIKAMLRYEVEKQIAQCKNDVECLVEIGGALGVDYLVMGGLGDLGGTYVINLSLLDPGEAKVAQRVSEAFRGPPEQLAQAIRFAAWKLIGRASTGTGQLSLVTNVDRGAVTIDGGKPQAFSGLFVVGPLTGGKHHLRIVADGYYQLAHEFYVTGGQTTALHANLEVLPDPWYQKWWVWTAIGAAVAISASVAAYTASRDPDEAIVDVKITR